MRPCYVPLRPHPLNDQIWARDQMSGSKRAYAKTRSKFGTDFEIALNPVSAMTTP